MKIPRWISKDMRRRLNRLFKEQAVMLHENRCLHARMSDLQMCDGESVKAYLAWRKSFRDIYSLQDEIAEAMAEAEEVEQARLREITSQDGKIIISKLNHQEIGALCRRKNRNLEAFWEITGDETSFNTEPSARPSIVLRACDAERIRRQKEHKS